MRDDSCLHFRLGVSNPDRRKCITLELYFTFKLSASEDAVFQSSHFWLYITLINIMLLLTEFEVYTRKYLF